MAPDPGRADVIDQLVVGAQQQGAPVPAQALARMQAASAGLEARVARGEWGGMLGGWLMIRYWRSQRPFGGSRRR